MAAIGFKGPHDSRNIKGILFTAGLGNDDTDVRINLSGIDNKSVGARWDIVICEDGTWHIS